MDLYTIKKHSYGIIEVSSVEFLCQKKIMKAARTS